MQGIHYRNQCTQMFLLCNGNRPQCINQTDRRALDNLGQGIVFCLRLVFFSCLFGGLFSGSRNGLKMLLLLSEKQNVGRKRGLHQNLDSTVKFESITQLI